jgi:putative N-acetylmannosamine-6-phosphate epimerase
MKKIEVFKKHLREKRAIKVISGIDNYNEALVKKVAIAAQSGLASALDVAAREDIIKVAKANTKLPIFASSTQPFALLNAVRAGADAIEIGNYEALYKTNASLTAEEVYEITLETMDLVSKYDTFISVTIPGTLAIEDQIELAQRLEILGIDLIQTEGVAQVSQKAQSTISNTLELIKRVNVPVMTASGLTPETVPMAFAAGASAVGVGSCINKLDTQIAMIAAVRQIVGSVAYRNKVMGDIRVHTLV